MRPGEARELAGLALPAVLSYVLANAFRVVDQFWVQFLPDGAAAQAAIGNTTFVVIANHALFLLVAAGALPLVARARGAGDRERRDALVRAALALALFLALLVGVAGELGTQPIVDALGLQGASAERAREYLRTLYALVPGFALAPVLDQLLLGLGNARAALVLQIVTVLLNLVLVRLLVLGWGALPAQGIAGAALAAGLSRLVAALVGLVWLARREGVCWWRGGSARGLVLEIARTGAPQACATLAYALVYFGVLRWIVNPLGTAVQAGFAIGFTAIEGFTFPFSLGVAMAGATMIGRRLGAGEIDSAWHVVRTLRRVGFAVGLCVAVLYWSLGARAVGLFTDDALVRAEAARYVFVIAFSQLFVALEAVHERVLLGAGRTQSILAVSAPLNALRVPLGWLAAVRLGLGAEGMWWVLNATSLGKACVYAWVVQRGRWARGGLRAA